MSFHFTKLASSKINKKLLHAAQCSLCPLANNPQNKHPNMPADGSIKPDIYLLGLGPSSDEDEIGKPFVGKSGKFLRSCFSEEQWSKTRRNNVTRTRGLDNSPPPEAVECCRPSVEKDILETKPKAIFGFGQYPLQWVLGEKYNGQVTMNTWRNRHFPINIKGHEMWFFPMFHPSYIVRSEKTAPELEQVFKRDIKTAYNFLAKDIQPALIKSHTYYNGIEIEFKSLSKIESFIDNLLKTSNRFAIDIETAADLPPGHNIPRPYHANSRILSISIGTFDKCMAFPLDHPEAKWTPSERKKLDLLLLKLLLSNLIKIAHNSVYELEWLLNKYSKKIAYKNWICTLTQGYILDGRRGLLGLGDLTLLYFGFNLKQLSNVNSANLTSTPIEDVLTYNSMDSKYTDLIYLHQQKLLEEDPIQLEVFERQNRKLPATVLTQIKGIKPDLDEARRIDKEVDIKIHKLLDDISHHKDVKEYISRFGGFNANSPQDVIKLFKYLGFDMSKEVVSKTESGRKVETKDSSDEETLSKIEHPVAKWVLEIRKLTNKLKSTYLDSFIGKENTVYPDGKLHPYFNVNSTATLRLCIAKGSKIEVIRDISKYPNGIPIEDVKVGDLAYSYSANGQLEIKKVKWAGYTGKKKVIRLYWKAHSKNGYLDLTPTHEILQSNNKYINAQNSITCSIKALARGTTHGYARLWPTKLKEIAREHRFIYKQLFGDIPKGYVIHHKDGNKLNNQISNLELKSLSDHVSYHSSKYFASNINKANWYKTLNPTRLKGDTSPNWINISRFQCLKLIVKYHGQLTYIQEMDYKVFLIKLKYHNIDLQHIKDRYGKGFESTYLNKNIITKNLNKLGIAQFKVFYHIDLYRLKRLLKYFNINQFENHKYQLKLISSKEKIIELLQSVNGQITKLPYDFNSFKQKAKKFGVEINDFKTTYNNHFIYKIEELSDEVDVYDLEIEDNNNFIANELCVHNSSDSPNFQNFPKHTDEAIVRKIIKAPQKHKLVSLDYGQIEYRTGVMNSKDPTLIKAIFTNYDIHKDWAIRIAKAYPKRVGGDLKAFLNDPKAIKELRQITKSGWTFAGMFNATPKTKAEYMEIPLEIAKKLDKEFWAELKTLKEWQNRMYDFVAKNGYIETLTHYRRKYGKKTPYLESGEVVNTPIQESAATIVMDAFCRICEYAIETNQEKYIPIWQIHDDLGFVFPEETMEEDYNKIAYMMLDCHFSFINVPLAVEISVGDNWYEMKEIKIIDSVDVGLMKNPYV